MSVQNVLVIRPDIPAPQARKAGDDPLKNVLSALDAKNRHHLNKLASVKAQLVAQRDEARAALNEYETSRGRMTLLAYLGEVPKDELAVSAKIAAEHRTVIEDIDLAMPLLEAGGKDPELEAVKKLRINIQKTYSVMEVLSVRCLQLSLGHEQMAASMHLKQKASQGKALVNTLEALKIAATTAYGADPELDSMMDELIAAVEAF